MLGEKVRDRVRVYNGAVRFPLASHSPTAYAENMARMKESWEGFTIIKQGIGFHGDMAREVPDFLYGDLGSGGHGNDERGLVIERGLRHVIACVEAMKDVLGDAVGLALDCGRFLPLGSADTAERCSFGRTGPARNVWRRAALRS